MPHRNSSLESAPQPNPGKGGSTQNPPLFSLSLTSKLLLCSQRFLPTLKPVFQVNLSLILHLLTNIFLSATAVLLHKISQSRRAPTAPPHLPNTLGWTKETRSFQNSHFTHLLTHRTQACETIFASKKWNEKTNKQAKQSYKELTNSIILCKGGQNVSTVGNEDLDSLWLRSGKAEMAKLWMCTFSACLKTKTTSKLHH